MMCYLFAFENALVGYDDDLLVALGGADRLGNAVGIAAVVDVARQSARYGRVDHVVVAEAEHVDAAILLLVELLAPVGHLVAYELANVLDDHRVLLEVARRIQAQALDARLGQVDVGAPLGAQLLHLRRLGQRELLDIRDRVGLVDAVVAAAAAHAALVLV